jgi:hypothetical protein
MGSITHYTWWIWHILTTQLSFRSAEDIKTQANQEYKAGHYADAIRLYTKAIGKLQSH